MHLWPYGLLPTDASRPARKAAPIAASQPGRGVCEPPDAQGNHTARGGGGEGERSEKRTF